MPLRANAPGVYVVPRVFCVYAEMKLGEHDDSSARVSLACIYSHTVHHRLIRWGFDQARDEVDLFFGGVLIGFALEMQKER